MALHEYECKECGKVYTVRTFTTKPYSTRCPRCNSPGTRLVSLPGFRRDHTIS